MNLVVDSNVLFTFFWKNSAFREILKQKIKPFSTNYALEEINEHAIELIEKTQITKKDFEKLKEKLVEVVQFFPEKDYSSHFNEASTIVNELPKNEQDELLGDIDFLALALKLNYPIWSNDKLLKKQTKIIVLTTKELIALLEPNQREQSKKSE